MYYEAKPQFGDWNIGFATSTDGENWTKDADNPIITGSINPKISKNPGGAHVHKIDEYYYIWFHSWSVDGGITDITLMRTDVLNDSSRFEENPNRPCYTFPRTEGWEGVGLSAGQVADMFVLRVNGTTHAWYGATEAQAGGYFSIGHVSTSWSILEIYNNMTLDDTEPSTISFQSINNLGNNSVIQDQCRWFNWTRYENTTSYSIRISNTSAMDDIFLQLDNITVSNGWCNNTFLNTSASASPHSYNYWENSTHCYFYLPYVYNITDYGYDYYQVRAYT